MKNSLKNVRIIKKTILQKVKQKNIRGTERMSNHLEQIENKQAI